MNIDEQLDLEIAELEKKLTGGEKVGKKMLHKELEEENMLDLFSCVDHILKGDFKRGKAVSRSDPAEADQDEDDGEEEEDMGEEEYGEEEDEMDEDGIEEDAGEEGLEEFEGDEEGFEEVHEADQEIVEDEKKLALNKNQIAPASSLNKRPPNLAEETPLFRPNIKVSELADLLFINFKDNKELLSQVNRLCSYIHQNKLSGIQIAQAVFISNGLKKPEDPSRVAAVKKVEKKDGEKDKKEKRHESKDKTVTYAVSTDRLKVALYTLILFPRPYTVGYLKTLHKLDETLFTWSLSGLLVLGAVHGQVLVDNLKQLKKAPHKTEADNMDYEVHVIGKVVREKEPGCFKELSVVLKERYSGNPEVITRLTSHLEKLRNNMDIPGKTPFEVSNTVSKLLEKMVKKRRTDDMKPVNSLKEITEESSTGEKSTANAGPGAKNQNKNGGDALADDPQLQKVAEKLELVTQIEKKVFKIINKSTDYIDVVQGLIALKTHGSENKEVATPIIKCCLAEKSYNGFYAAAAQKLIALKPEFKYSFQLALFDEIKDLKESGEEGGQNVKSLGLFAASLITSSSVDHRFFKFLDDSPLPVTSAKICRIVLEQMIKKMPKDTIRQMCKKLTASMDVAANMKRIAKYLAKRKRENGGDPDVEERITRWLDEVSGGPAGDEDFA